MKKDIALLMLQGIVWFVSGMCFWDLIVEPETEATLLDLLIAQFTVLASVGASCAISWVVLASREEVR